MNSALEHLFICAPDLNSVSKIVEQISSGNCGIENQNIIHEFLSTGLAVDEVQSIIRRLIEKDILPNQVFHIAIGLYIAFCKYNWNIAISEKTLKEYFGINWPENVISSNALQSDSVEMHSNIIYPELFLLSYRIFQALYLLEDSLLYLWWYFRCTMTHQIILEDTSASLYKELELLIAKLSNLAQNAIDSPRLRVLLYAEIGQAYIMYGRVQKVEEYLTKAKEIAGLKLKLTGILGKRTKHQQMLLPQLALSSTLDGDSELSASEVKPELPKQIELDDDVRLNQVQYEEDVMQAKLPSLEQSLCVLTIEYLQKAQPKDGLADEELKPYIELVLSQKESSWCAQVTALLIRCKLEANNKRTVSRAMMQCEAIVHDKNEDESLQKLLYLWSTGLPLGFQWRQQLADLYLSLGLVKAALEEYNKLHLWEEIVVCYTLLQLRHKAAEVIQQQIDIEPTVKLYCLLGDATDDIACYEKAWEFSNCKSSRAQRHWGNYLYEHKNYKECIKHYEKSLEINSLQEGVWHRLGYCALVTENWELCAKAYRRYTYLQPNSFEAWNNLAKAYVNQNDKPRAYRALMEALRFNYDSWKLWENVVAVSIDTGHFEDAIRGCHRIIDLQNKYQDVEVLGVLVQAIVKDEIDADGNPASRLRKRVLELFGRITSLHQNKPEIWQLYADLSPTLLLRGQRLVKAYGGFTQMHSNWPGNPTTCKQVVLLAISLLECCLKARQECEERDIPQCGQLLSSARLTGQAVLRASQNQNWPECVDDVNTLSKLFNTVTEYLKLLL